MENRLCPCCYSHYIVDYIVYKDLPEILFPVDAAVKDDIRFYDLHLMLCESCGHVFQKNILLGLNERIYRDLYKYYPFSASETFYAPYREPFNKVFESITSGEQTNGKILLEIGFSSIDNMRIFCDKGFYCTGVDPSSMSFEKQGVRVFGETYENIQFKESFDVIVMRFNLEHIVDLDFLMNKLVLDVKEDGLVIVQVPNVQNFIKNGTLCIGAHEHTNYFSKESLIRLFNRFGFRCKYFADIEMPSLIAGFVKSSHKEKLVNQFQHNHNSRLCLKDMINTATASIQKLMTDYEHIYFYGAGLQLVWLLYYSGIDFDKQEISIIDDNTVVQGRYMPGWDIPIIPFKASLLEKKPLIVLSLNQVYHNNVIAKLRADLRYHPTIAVFDGAEFRIIV